eukprot:Sspe_Gene.17551::Locus_6232_Transcript_1_1_Confidence_1.000_Length_359::g.17551::m.17551
MAGEVLGAAVFTASDNPVVCCSYFKERRLGELGFVKAGVVEVARSVVSRQTADGKYQTGGCICYLNRSRVATVTVCARGDSIDEELVREINDGVTEAFLCEFNE